MVTVWPSPFCHGLDTLHLFKMAGSTPVRRGHIFMFLRVGLGVGGAGGGGACPLDEDFCSGFFFFCNPGFFLHKLSVILEKLRFLILICFNLFVSFLFKNFIWAPSLDYQLVQCSSLCLFLALWSILSHCIITCTISCNIYSLVSTFMAWCLV